MKDTYEYGIIIVKTFCDFGHNI